MLLSISIKKFIDTEDEAKTISEAVKTALGSLEAVSISSVTITEIIKPSPLLPQKKAEAK